VLKALGKICHSPDGSGLDYDQFCEMILSPEDTNSLLRRAGHSGIRPLGTAVGGYRHPQAGMVFDKEYKHVDHALEAFRQGSAMGGYTFDGVVDKIGAGDDAPVTDEELERAHDIIREKVTTRFSTFRRAFRMIDEDRSGKVSEYEYLRVCMMLNLSNIREKVVRKLGKICDKDGDGIEYDEFCELMMAEDALPLIKRCHAGHAGLL